jgi:hypothetical protein
MGENFFSNIRTADNIRMAIPSLSQIGTSNDRFVKDQLAIRIKELISLYNNFTNLENNAYKKMGVSSLEEL